MRIGYFKFGRTMKFNEGKFGFQGDAEAPQLLFRLARRNPHVTWVVVGHNTADDFPDYPNIENPWHNAKEKAANTPRYEGPYTSPFAARWSLPPSWWCSEVSGFEDDIVNLMASLDGMVGHVGQHGTSHISIPQSNKAWVEAYHDPDGCATHTYDWAKGYGRYLVRGLNAFCDRNHGKGPVVWLVTDPRNFIKIRDLKWPTGTDDILAQYQYSREQRHERFMDTRSPDALNFGDRAVTMRHNELWMVRHSYRYGGLELMILPDNWDTWGYASFDERKLCGIATTSFSATLGRAKRRSEYVNEYMLHAFPDAEVFGKWDKGSLADVPDGVVIQNKPGEFPELLNRWRVTMALPALGSSWTTAKPFQCFAANVVCFMIDNIDHQGWIIPTWHEAPGTKPIPGGMWSIRDDWTPDDINLAAWLRCGSAREFSQKAMAVAYDSTTWKWIVNAQRDLLQRRWNEALLENEIERKLGIGGRHVRD